MECPVCYEKAADDNYQKLECNHSLCKSCLSKLRQRNCPLCRSPINFGILPMAPDNSDEILWERVDAYNFEFSVEVQSVPVRRRRRRRRRRHHNNGELGIPSPRISDVVSTNEIQEIVYDMTVSFSITEPISVSDRQRQKARHQRAVWKRCQSHNTSRYYSRR